MSSANMFAQVEQVIHSIFVYCAFTRDGYVKVGISRTPFERIATIHAGSPSPVQAAQWTWVGSLTVGTRIEKELKKLWDDRNTRGEWYKFDYTSAEDKADFHYILNSTVEHFSGSPPEWKKLSQKGVSELLTEAQAVRRAGSRHPWRDEGKPKQTA